MKFRFVYLKPINIHAYRRPNCGIPMVSSLVEVESEGELRRFCYGVTYEDGFVDYVPLLSVENGDYKLVTNEIEITNDGGETFRT